MADEVGSAALQSGQKIIEVGAELIKLLAPLFEKMLKELYRNSVDSINQIGGSIAEKLAKGTVTNGELLYEANKAECGISTTSNILSADAKAFAAKAKEYKIPVAVVGKGDKQTIEFLDRDKGIVMLVWQRGDDVTPYIRELHTALKRVDPSRPTVALSNQDGELNTITDLIALKQNVGWMRGTTDDVGYWCETLHKSWGNLLAAPCYGVPGYPSQQDDLLGRPTPGTHWLPERWQTRFHEEYARRIVSDPAFCGEWVNAMFDFGTARGANDRYACGMVTLDRRQKKDIYYLYRTLWNRREPTLYIAERRWRVRPSAEQRIKVYSSGEDPVLLVNGDSVALTKYAEGQFRADCKLLPGENRIEARCGELRDSVALRVGTALKARDFEALRKTKGLRSKD